MRIHEVAHQWWGNIVSPATYHHDWLMEALANYSALLYERERPRPQTDGSHAGAVPQRPPDQGCRR
jgi:aminopeptidase N